MKTKYEKKVESGETEPLQGLDVAFIDLLVCDIIEKKIFTEEEGQTILDLWEEIEFLYKDDSETINELEKIIKRQ
jgi:hypothetical protein